MNRQLLFSGRAAPVSPIVSDLVGRAVAERATDIHIDPWQGQAVVRFRIDGVLHTIEKLTPEQVRRLVNQIKVAAELEIDAPFVPLEGQFRWFHQGGGRDIRVTIVPTASHFEALHMRLLTTIDQWRGARHLGLSERDLLQIERVMQNPHGLILIAGPTGSGKTTTLYALLELEDLQHRLAASIEDPAEFDLPFVRQLEVDTKHGVTMEEGLRTLLRMDPDILLIGEVRDRASAAIAAQAALSGRLVLATIHGRDPASVIEGMHFLDVPYFVLGGALRMVMVQSLVRRLCRDCARPRDLLASERILFEHAHLEPPQTVLEPDGCGLCNNLGYIGRTGVFEVALIDDDLGAWLAQGPRQHEVRQRFAEMGARSLLVDALNKAKNGITSLKEVLQFVGQDVDRPLVRSDSLLELPGYLISERYR